MVKLWMSISSVIAVLVALFYAFARQGDPTTSDDKTVTVPVFLPGRNNTVLFLTNSDHGLRNAILATASSLLTRHPQVEVHVGGFPDLEPRVHEIVNYARRTTAAASANFHSLPAKSYGAVVFSDGRSLTDLIHPAGFWGAVKFGRALPMFLMPWTGADYLAIYQEIRRIIDQVDPAIVAIDPALFPAIDAVRYTNRNYLVLSTNSIKENGAAEQGADMLWKHPAFASGFSYPIPWWQIPLNVLLNLSMALRMVMARHVNERTAWLRDHGLNVTGNPLVPACHDSPLCITQSLREAEYPFNIPDKFKTYGPMVLSLATAEDQDAELTVWTKRSPTILINLGSVFSWQAESTRAMALALKAVLEKHRVQILWKLTKRTDFDDAIWKNLLVDSLESQRVKVVSWLQADPTALMETGNIVLAVHHGGASSFYEPLSVGIPQLLLPHWADCYDAAVKAEYIGVGIWGNKKQSPDFDVDELTEAFEKLLDDGQVSRKIRARAQEVGQICQKAPGRHLAAAHIAHLARGGRSEEFQF